MLTNCRGSGERLVPPKRAPKSFRSLMQRCWREKPAKRPGMRKICSEMAVELEQHEESESSSSAAYSSATADADVESSSAGSSSSLAGW